MSARLKLKELQGYLQSLDGFSKPRIELEQYETPAHIAAVSLFTIQTQYEDIEGKLVLDAGCGPGMLSVGSALLGAGFVTGVDIDKAALQDFRNNSDELEITNLDIIQCDFLGPLTAKWESYFDTVIMNPPFGTKQNSGTDMKFLKKGLELSSNCVYSLHKSTTRSYIEKKVKEWEIKGEVIAELKYNLPASYKFHKQQSKDIAVDLWRLEH